MNQFEEDGKQFSFSLPYPPSVNNIYSRSKYGVFLKEKVKEYRKQILFSFKNKVVKFGNEKVSVHIQVFPPDKRKRDLDNLLKVTLDSLQLLKIIEDDNQIDELHICRGNVLKDGKVNICTKLSKNNSLVQNLK